MMQTAFGNIWDGYSYNQELDFLSQWAQEAAEFENVDDLSPHSYTGSTSDQENNDDSTDGESKRTCPIKRQKQRHAANQRERKRMKSINTAFEGLKNRIPISSSERKKISKVDTLKYAIQYIQNLTETLEQCDDVTFRRKDKKEIQEKVILMCKTEFLQENSTGDSDIICHSLSWKDEKSSQMDMSPEKTLVTKLWIPESAKIVDDSMLYSMDPVSHEYFEITGEYDVLPEMVPMEQSQMWGYC